jgi:hypothetical protein
MGYDVDVTYRAGDVPVKRRMRSFSGVFAVTVLAAILLMLIVTKVPETPAVPNQPVHQSDKVIKVMTVGGSVAKGWKDDGWEKWKEGWYGGYLVRAVQELRAVTHLQYTVVDHTIVGANGSQLDTLYAGQYLRWLERDKPDVVAISWGILNDVRPKTPISVFRAKIQEEIRTALSHHAVVFIITPPVTEESYTDYRTQEEIYVQNEVQAAKAFHSPNVYVFDVFHQMKAYLKSHHQTILPYKGNSWHPNKRGHMLAGHILFEDIYRVFHENPVSFHT